MKQIGLMTAAFVVASILLASHSFYNEYAGLPPASRWFRTVFYGLGPWLSAAAFTGAKICFQKLLRREVDYRGTFQWVTGVILALMVFTKFIAK